MRPRPRALTDGDGVNEEVVDAPRVKKPLMVQLMDPQMKLKQRALMGQEKRQLPTVERAP